MAPKKGSIHKNLDKLGDLYEALKHRPVLEVGVFSTKNARRSGETTNATLACIHEYGSPEHGLPARSVLRIPLHDHASKIMSSIKGKEYMLLEGKKGVLGMWNIVGVACIKVIEQAFATGGFGKWQSLKGSTLMAKLKGSLKKRKDALGRIYAGQAGEGILIDRGELKRSYTFRTRMQL